MAIEGISSGSGFQTTQVRPQTQDQEAVRLERERLAAERQTAQQAESTGSSRATVNLSGQTVGTRINTTA